jgi:anti-sigma B factor antagonist
MKHSIKVSGDHAMISAVGEIYVEDAAKLRTLILDIIDKGVTNVTFDMSETTYIDSSGIGILVTINKRTMQKNGKLVLKGLQGMVKEIMELTCMDRVFTIE